MNSEKEYEFHLERLSSDDREVARDAAHALGDLGDGRAVEPLVRLMESTRDAIRWNAAAVGLRELEDPRAVEPLIRMIRDPKTEGARGTLVWALEVFDCAPYIEELVRLVIRDNYEVARNAASAIVGIEGEIDAEVWARCIRTLRAALSSASAERRPVLEQLLARFED